MYLSIYIQPQLGSLKLTFLMVKPPSWLLKSYIFHLFHHQKTASSSLAPFISEITGPPRWFSIGCLSESCELLELPQLDSRNGILPGKFEKKLINKYQVKYSEMVIQANVVGGVNNAWTQWPVNQPKKNGMGWSRLPWLIDSPCKNIAFLQGLVIFIDVPWYSTIIQLPLWAIWDVNLSK